jgi:pyridoxal phosphate enzyme (YggS family)
MTSSNIQNNLQRIQASIEKACLRAGREVADITLLPVSKTRPPEEVRLAFKCGITRFGENKVQEAQSKAEALSDLPLEWCIIGHLQSNKAKHVARFASELHSLDRLSLARALDKQLQKEGRAMDVLVQVNTSAEPQKYGVAPEDVMAFVKELPSFECLRVKGLMTLAVFSKDEQIVRPCFAKLSTLRDRLRQDSPSALSWDVLSMGMSGDYEIAIEEGATDIRIGQAIFGPRTTPDSYYWPQ